MKKVIYSCLFTFSWLLSFAQIENVRVETYYISDTQDATDVTGGILEEGSTTYRIFIDLQQGSSLKAIYGSQNHPLVFSSSHPFFNHTEDGVSFGKDLNRNRYELGTVPLDTYLTLGQVSKSFGQNVYHGVPKDNDVDGSLVGGIHNDGGSEEIEGGLLRNSITQLGIPLTDADGLATSNIIPDSWIDIGFKDVLLDIDTTIFGISDKSQFSRIDVLLRNAGVKGFDTISNEVFVAQLTTLGEIAFEINLEVEILVDGHPQMVKYVARNEMLKVDEIFSPLLKFPYTCGCTDPDYLEASTTFACTDISKCLTLITLGCMDTLACNYNANANVNLSDLCCYVGYCHDLDISVACPDLKPRVDIDQEQIILYPNPASTELYINLSFVQYNDISYRIVNSLGHRVDEGILQGDERQIDISQLGTGPYLIQLIFGEKNITRPFLKI